MPSKPRLLRELADARALSAVATSWRTVAALAPLTAAIARHTNIQQEAMNRLSACVNGAPHAGFRKLAFAQFLPGGVPRLFPSTLHVSKFDAVHRTPKQHPSLSYENSDVGKKRIIQGREVSDTQVQACADEAEAGYDVEELARRWGRPPRAETASKVIPTRFSDDELASLTERAEREGIDRSTAIRAAVREWAAA